MIPENDFFVYLQLDPMYSGIYMYDKLTLYYRPYYVEIGRARTGKIRISVAYTPKDNEFRKMLKCKNMPYIVVVKEHLTPDEAIAYKMNALKKIEKTCNDWKKV